MNTNNIDTIVSELATIDNIADIERALRAIAEARKAILANAAGKFAVGDRVTWTSELGRTMEGTVTKLNLRTVVAKTDVGMAFTLLGTVVTKL